ncbi:MAG: DUF4124 domain-containing protein [Betaproteobacteria bacterium]
MISGRIITLLGAAALAAAFVSQAQTNVYRWVDKDGRVHFSDTPPPPDAKQATQKRMGSGPADSAVQMPYATQQAMKRNPVTLYTSSGCGELCAQGRELLARRGVPYSERNAELNAADAEEVKRMIGKLEVPVLRVGEKHVKGYSEGSWQAALDSAGYARAPLPGQKVPPPPAAPEAPAATTDQQPAAAAPESAAPQAAPAPTQPR